MIAPVERAEWVLTAFHRDSIVRVAASLSAVASAELSAIVAAAGLAAAVVVAGHVALPAIAALQIAPSSFSFSVSFCSSQTRALPDPARVAYSPPTG